MGYFEMKSRKADPLMQ